MKDNELRKEVIDAVKDLEAGQSLLLELSENNSLKIGYADCWIGGEGIEGYMCDMLGNTTYTVPERIVDEVFNYVENELNLVVENIDY